MKCNRLRFKCYDHSLLYVVQHPPCPVGAGFWDRCHQYANDTQLYMLLGGQPDTIQLVFAKGLEAIAGWLKIAVLWLGRNNLGLGCQLLTAYPLHEYRLSGAWA